MNARTSFAALLTAALAIGGFSPTYAADKVEDIEKAMAEKWGEVKSFSANIETSGAEPSSASKGMYEYVMKGDKLMFRMEMTMGDASGGGQGMSMTTISDGEFSYTLMGQMATKMKQDNAQSMDPKAAFKMLRENYELKVLPDQSVDVQAVYVIEGSPKGGGAGGGKTVSYYAKDSGVALKSDTYDASGKLVTTMKLSNVKINPKIAPSRFVFEAPDGVQVMDMTKE